MIPGHNEQPDSSAYQAAVANAQLIATAPDLRAFVEKVAGLADSASYYVLNDLVDEARRLVKP
jgi:hypothetical protein